MSTFFEELPYSVEYGGETYKLTPAYDNVLNMYANLDGVTDAEKLEIMLYYLFEGDVPRDPGLLNVAAETLLTPHKKPKTGDDKKSFDFIQDADLIFAAFLQAYGIDLNEQRGKLHWWKFSALLSGLPDSTRFVKVVQIRTQPLPKPTKYNAAERAELMRQKQYFALETTAEEREKNMQRGLRKLAVYMETLAKQNEKKEG